MDSGVALVDGPLPHTYYSTEHPGSLTFFPTWQCHQWRKRGHSSHREPKHLEGEQIKLTRLAQVISKQQVYSLFYTTLTCMYMHLNVHPLLGNFHGISCICGCMYMQKVKYSSIMLKWKHKKCSTNPLVIVHTCITLLKHKNHGEMLYTQTSPEAGIKPYSN